jgi:hypothetical protein
MYGPPTGETRHLVEPTAKSFLYRTLQTCHDIKIKYFNLWLNLAVFIGFVGLFGTILYFRYKGQPSPYEKRQQFLRDQQYVLSKIRYYHDERARAGYTHIDELPKGRIGLNSLGAVGRPMGAA